MGVSEDLLGRPPEDLSSSSSTAPRWWLPTRRCAVC